MVPERPAGVAHVFQLERGTGLIQQTDNYLLAPDNRSDGDTQVNVFIDYDRKSAVLRDTVFVNFQVGQDFDAGNQGRLGVLGQAHDFAQYAVNPAADFEFFFQRLDVHVAGPVAGGEFQNGRQGLADRRILDDGLDVLFFFFCLLAFSCGVPAASSSTPPVKAASIWVSRRAEYCLSTWRIPASLAT